MTIRYAPAPSGGDDQTVIDNLVAASADGDEIVFKAKTVGAYKHSAKILVKTKPGITFRAESAFVSGNVAFEFDATSPSAAAMHIWSGSHRTKVIGLHHKVIGATTRIDQAFSVAPYVVDYSDYVQLIDCTSEGSAGLGIYVFFAHNGTYDRFRVLGSGADGFHLTWGSSYNTITDYYGERLGDDGLANIGYYNDGQQGRPHHNTWIRPVIVDCHARGMSFAGCYNTRVIDPQITRTRASSILFARENGADFKTMATNDCSVETTSVGAGQVRGPQTPRAPLGSSTNDGAVHSGFIIYDIGAAGEVTNCTVDGINVGQGGSGTSTVAMSSNSNPSSGSYVNNLQMYSGTPTTLWNGTAVSTSGWTDRRSTTMPNAVTTPVAQQLAVDGSGTATPAKVQAFTQVIIDAFTRTSTTTPGTASGGQAWRAEIGTWGTNGTQLYSVTSADNDQVTIDVGTKNQSLRAKFASIGTNKFPEMLARWVSVTSHYWAESDAAGKVTLLRRSGSAYDTLNASASGAYAAGKEVRFDAVDTEDGTATVLTAYVDGAQVVTFTDTTSTRPTGTRAGFRHGAAAGSLSIPFDDVDFRSVTYVTPASAPTFVAAASYDAASTAVVNYNITVPANVKATDVGIVFATWVVGSASDTHNSTGAGTATSILAPTAFTNEIVSVQTITGVKAGDVMTFTFPAARFVTTSVAFYSNASVDTIGAATARSSSVATVTAAAITQKVATSLTLVLATERTTATGTLAPTFSPGPTPTTRSFVEGTGSSTCSTYIGELALNSTSAPTQTLTYNSASGNGGALQLELGYKAAAAAGVSIVRSTLGLPTATSIRAAVKTSGATSVRLAVSTASTMANPVYSASQTPDSLGYTGGQALPLAVTGLTANTAYWWQIEVNGSLLGAISATRTLPAAGTATAFSFVAGCCNVTGANDLIFDTIRTMRSAASLPAAFMAHLGDIHYFHSASSGNAVVEANDAAEIASHYEASLSASKQLDLYRTIPLSHTFSDNDFAGSNSDSTFAAAATVTDTRRRILADPALPGTGVYKTWVVGRVRFIQTDSRSFLSAKGSNGTYLGSAQKQWFKDTLSAATERVIVWLNDNNWAGTATNSTSLDDWRNYSTERTEMSNFITASGKAGRMVFIHGDSHLLAYDSGANNPFGGFPLINIGPLRQSSSDHPAVNLYDGGKYPTTNGVVSYQFGWFDVTDNGSRVALTFTGYSVDPSTGAATSRKSFTKTVDPDPPTRVSGALTSNGVNWVENYSTDFDTAAALGTFHSTSAYASRFDNYDGLKDTSGFGTYDSTKTTFVADGKLQIRLQTISSVPTVSAPIVRTIEGQAFSGQTYGRYSIAMRAVSEALDDGSWKVAFMLWPTDDKWPQHGEYDFPEGGLRSDYRFYAAHHQANNNSTDTVQKFEPTTSTPRDWHVYTIEWAPGIIRYFVDDVLIGSSTTGVYAGNMRWTLQAETEISSTAPNPSSIERVEVAWLTQWSYPDAPPATSKFAVWDGTSAQTVQLLGYWNGTSLEPVEILGIYNGSTIDPIS